MNNLPETAHGTLSLLFNTKQQNVALANKFISEIEDGNISALKAHIYIKSIENLIKQFTDSKENDELSKKYKKLVSDEADTYAGKSFELHGAKFTKTETGVKYDYSACGDKTWNDLEYKIASLLAAKKIREDFLKNVPVEGHSMIDEESGEVFTVFPPSKSSTSAVNCSLPK